MPITVNSTALLLMSNLENTLLKSMVFGATKNEEAKLRIGDAVSPMAPSGRFADGLQEHCVIVTVVSAPN